MAMLKKRGKKERKMADRIGTCASYTWELVVGRITRIYLNIRRFTCFHRLAAVPGVVSFLRFFHSIDPSGSEKERGRSVYLNCRCRWKNAASARTHPRTHAHAHLLRIKSSRVPVDGNVEKRDVHIDAACGWRATEQQTPTRKTWNRGWLRLENQAKPHCRDVLLVFHLPVTLPYSFSFHPLSFSPSFFDSFPFFFRPVLILVVSCNEIPDLSEEIKLVKSDFLRVQLSYV